MKLYRSFNQISLGADTKGTQEVQPEEAQKTKLVSRLQALNSTAGDDDEDDDE